MKMNREMKKNILIAAFYILIFLICQLLTPFLIGRTIDSLGYIDKDNIFIYQIDSYKVVLYLSLCITLSFIGVIFNFLFDYSVGKITQRYVRDLRVKVFKKITSVSIKTIHDKEIGDLLQLEISDIENVQNGIYSVLKQLVLGILQIAITVIMMFVTNWILALTVILLSPLSILVSKFVASFSHKYFSKQAKDMTSLTSYSLETLSNAELVQSLNYQDECQSIFENKDDCLSKTSKVAQFSSSWVNPSTRLVNNIIYCLVGILGIILILFSPAVSLFNMTIGRLSTFLTYTSQYSKPFNEISSVFAEAENAKYSLKRIQEFLALSDDVDDGEEDLNEEINSIVFEDMSFSYSKNKKLIEHFSLEIKKGMKVAIVGETGAGKSTLINLLMRFYDPDSGRILINNKDYTKIKKSELRKHFSMVLQETWIFKGTVEENIKYAKGECSIEEIKEAAIKANCDSFIQTLPSGYDTLVSSKEGLSQGERQMVTIARIMLLNNEVVILDEATSNVDTKSEKRINDAFDKLLKGKTSIVIAHRLSTIKEADVILVIKKGQIVEQGNHYQLLNKKGYYYQLFSSQFK
ncbi:MAG: ABC transporter ATP-binding protein [Candidatus Enterosoma sp.]|nr:ABC transporter ATP-binding protein [Candidatus Enterosoma sp.]